MPRQTLVVCDNCQTQQLEKDAAKWLVVNIQSIDQDTSISENPIFCSYGCLGHWGEDKEAQLAPA